MHDLTPYKNKKKRVPGVPTQKPFFSLGVNYSIPFEAQLIRKKSHNAPTTTKGAASAGDTAIVTARAAAPMQVNNALRLIVTRTWSPRLILFDAPMYPDISHSLIPLISARPLEVPPK